MGAEPDAEEPPAHRLRALQGLSVACGALVLLVALLVLVGWALGIPALQSVRPGWVSMKPNAAFALALLGASLLLAALPRRYARALSLALAVPPLLVGIVTIAEYASGVDLGFGTLFFEERPGAPFTVAPGRPSPFTALAGALASTALLTIDRETRRGRRPAEALAIAVGAVGLLHLVPYAYGVEAFDAALPGTAMAVHTAAAFVLLAVGLFAARPGRGLMRLATSHTPGGVSLRRLTLPLMAVTYVLGALAISGARVLLYDLAFGVALLAVSSLGVIGVLGVLHARMLDRTQRAGAATEAMYRNLVRSSQDAIVTTARDQHVTSWNAGAQRLYGYPAHEAIGQDAGALLGNGEASAKLHARVLAGESIERHETTHRRKDGSIAEVSVSVSPMRDASGRVIGVSSIAHDVGRTRRAEEKFQALLESAPDAIVITDDNGRIVLANAQAEVVFGYPREELIGHPIEKLIPGELRPRHVGHRAAFARDPRTRPMGAGLDLRALRKDGVEFPVEISLSPIMTDEGLLVSAAVRDVTDRKEAERRLRASLREKEALLREIHHRVKNNLQVTSSLLLLQSQQVDDPKTRDLFKDSIARVRSMALVHEKLYGSARIADVDFADYLEDLAVDLARMYGAAERGIDVGLRVEPLRVDVDTCMNVGLVLNELVSNAFKHAFPGERAGHVEITFRLEDQRGVLTVRDDGVGFPEALDPENAATMGLRLVAGLVHQLEGTIGLERGEGSAVRVDFPITPRARAQGAPA